MYKIQLTKDAAKYYKKSDVSTKKHLNQCFEVLKNTPYHNSSIKRLQGELSGLYRYRVGSIRVIYKVEETEITVFVVAIGSRGDIYK
jgi:mRNA interferase RelE/StbE